MTAPAAEVVQAGAEGAAIAGVEAVAVRVSLPVPTAFSTRIVRHREYVLVTLRDADGAEGVGYTYAGDSGGGWVRDAVEELIGPALLGRDAGSILESSQRLGREFLLVGRGGGFARALSAVDIAGWDLLARRARLPLHRLLGGHGGSVPAYASGGYYREGDPVAAVVEEVERYRELGFRDYKMKVGGAALALDVERVRAARAALGDEGRLALDANNAWRSAHEAVAAIRAFAEVDLWWVEEPLPPDDVAGHAAVRRKVPVAVATGELQDRRELFAELLRAEAVDVLQPDACVLGGIGEWLRTAAAACLHGVDVAPHWHANLHAQLAAATSNCIAIEYFAPEMRIYNFEELLARPLAVSEGRAVLPEGPGIGVELDPERVAHYTI